ncbi:hypothetical protein [Sedimenticola hydrogenitrophicus]|uniref:hypothetical protein n=1 Tax=Sedimenticola hydrogenitrophicus TaxID=2967975 RepID=UPI0021A28423|nr:hypothetical protein [Sedimenticola hydrogenitrophicus]
MTETTNNKRMIWLLCGGLLALSGTLSEGVVASESGSYGDIGAGVARIDYPDSQFFAERGEAAPFTRNYNLDTDEGVAYGAAIDGRIGTFLPGTIANADSARVELQGFWMSADRNTNRSFSDTGAGMRFGWVELDNSTGFGTPNGGTLTTRIEQDLKYWGADLMFLLDYGIGLDASWSFQVGPSFKRLDQDSDAAGAISTTVSLQDRLSTDFRGLRIGARYDRNLNLDWSVAMDGSVSRYWTKADYNGSYADSSPNTQTASLSDSDNALGLDLRLELNRKLGKGMKLSVFGQVNHLSDVPQVSYGSVPTDTGNGVLSLTSDDMTTLVLGVEISGSF